MKRVAFFDVQAGVAGDMLLAALLDAGAPRGELEAGLKSIKELASEWSLETKRVVRGQGHIAGLHVKVKSIYGHKAIPVGARAGHSHTLNHHHHKHHHHEHHHHEHHHHRDTPSNDSNSHSAEDGAAGQEQLPSPPGHQSYEKGHHHDHDHHHDHHHHDHHDHHHDDDHHVHYDEHGRNHHHGHNNKHNSEDSSLPSSEGEDHHHHHPSHGHAHGPPGHHHHQQHSHEHGDGAGHTYHDHHDHHHHHGPHRHLVDIQRLIESADGLPAEVKRQSIAVFYCLGKAEAATHGVTLDQIHFHEVGAVDSIIDTVGVVLALHLLGVQEVWSSKLPFGEGMTGMTEHGILPVPPPATLRLLLGMPTRPGPKGATGELVTPTGAALVKVLAGGRYGQPPPFTPSQLGVGAGTKDFALHANVVRVVIGETNKPAHHHHYEHMASATATAHSQHVEASSARIDPSASQSPQPSSSIPAAAEAAVDAPIPPASFLGAACNVRTLTELSSNLDDMDPEAASFVLDRIMMEQGVLDVWFSPAAMKKGRSAAQTLHVLCEPECVPDVLKRVFKETPTLGVRLNQVQRVALDRHMTTVQTQYGPIRVKVATLEGKVMNTKPEFEDCKEAALACDVPLKSVTEKAKQAAASLELSC